MADNKYISLKVCGNQYANSGFMPLVSFNSPSFEVTDAEYSGFNTNSYFFSIRIERSQVVYTLIKNNVRSCNGALREGSLKIAIAIPKGYKIANGKTPYDALIRLKDSFISSCMTCKDSIKGVYEFNTGIINPNVLDEMAREFTLENASGPYHTMTVGAPKGYIILPEESMNLLFNDVQYVEFASYGEIIIASLVQNTNYTALLNLSVPRKRSYRIIVDGVEEGSESDLMEQISIKGRKDNNYYDNSSIEFSISDLQNGKILPKVILDEENETVSIDTSDLSTPKKVKVSIIFEDTDAGYYFHSYRKYFQLTYGQRVISINDDYTFVLSGETIARLANPSGFNPTFSQRDKYTIEDKALIVENGEYLLKIKTKKVVIPSQRPPVQQDSKLRESEVYKVDIVLSEKPENGRIKFGVILPTANEEVEIQSSQVKLDYSGTYHKGVIYIPKSKSYDATSLEVCYETSDRKYISDIQRDPKTDTYVASRFEASKKNLIERVSARNKTVLVALLTLLAGILIGYVISPLISKVLDLNHVKCPDCGQTFKNDGSLDDHMSLMHLTHDCSYDGCSAEFRSKEELDNHVSSEHLTYDCTYGECGAEFNTQEKLDEHINRLHLRYKCSQCEKRFETEQARKEHEASAHKTSQPKNVQNTKFKCVTCSKKFSTQDELYDHMKKHGKHVCRICGVDTWFKTENDLNKHMRSKHSDVER